MFTEYKHIVKNLLLLIATLVLSINSIFSQIKSVDSNYVKEFPLPNNVQFFSGKWDHKFLIQSSTQRRRTNHLFFPNTGLYTGIFFNYKWFVLTYSREIPLLTYYPINKQLKSDHWNLFRFWDRFGLAFDKTKIEGLLYRDQRNYQKPIILKNITFNSYTADFYYFLNKKYSYRAAVYSSRQQVKSAGSLILDMTPSYNSMRSESVVDETSSIKNLRSNIMFNDPKWFGLKSSVGYGYNFSLKKGKFIINPLVFYSFSLINSKQNSRFTYNNGFRYSFNVGYHGNKYFALLNADWDRYDSKIRQSSFNQLKSDISMSLGMRFGNYKKPVIKYLNL